MWLFFMQLDQVEALLKNIEGQYNDYPPVDSWHPEKCGDIDIRIDRDGNWYHESNKFERDALVQLFSKLLRKEGKDYFLVTPAEKVRITVDCAPLVIISLVTVGEGEEQDLFFTTNTNEQIHLAQPLKFHTIEYNGQQLPCLPIRNGLSALIHRNVYYELAALVEIDEEECAYIMSAGSAFYLPEI